jgi:S1-C subfamily serine protease
LPGDARFCLKCGEPVEGFPRLTWFQRTARGQTGAIVVGVVGLGIVTLIILLLLSASLSGARRASALDRSRTPVGTVVSREVDFPATILPSETQPPRATLTPTTEPTQTADLTSTADARPPATPTAIFTPTAVPIFSEQDAVAAVLPSVVRIQAGDSVGTGVVLDVSDTAGSGRAVMTNAHVVGVSKRALVSFQPGEQVQAPVVRVDPTADLAILELADNLGTAARLADVAQLQLGEPRLAIGYALDLRGGPSVTRGVFSAHRSDSDGIDYVQTDAPINPGNSGGPLISLKAQVVGVNTFRLDGVGGESVQGLGFAVSSTSIRQFLSNTPRQAPPPTAGPRAGESSAVDAVQAYYQLINQRSFSQAWELLSSGFHTTISRENWIAGYASTRFVYVTDARQTSQNGLAAIVAVTVVAVDEQNGQYVTHTYGGQWQLVVERGAWRLDVGSIHVIV